MAASALALLCLVLFLSAGAAARLASSTPSCPAVKGLANPKWLPLKFNFTLLPRNVEAINNAGTIAELNGITRPPYSKYRKVKYPKAKNTYSQGLNSKGVVVGSITLTSGPHYTYGFVSNGSYENRAGYTMYKHPNATKPTKTFHFETVFTAINDNNTVVGYYIDSKRTYRGFSFSLDTGIWTPLVSAYSVSLYPTGINNLGVITGSVACASDNSYGFLYSKGVFSYFSLFASHQTYPTGINSRGYVVGFYKPLKGINQVAFVAANVTTSPSVFTFDVVPSSPGSSFPTGINDQGNIVGIVLDVLMPTVNGFVGVKN